MRANHRLQARAGQGCRCGASARANKHSSKQGGNCRGLPSSLAPLARGARDADPSTRVMHALFAAGWQWSALVTAAPPSPLAPAAAGLRSVCAITAESLLSLSPSERFWNHLFVLPAPQPRLIAA